VVNIAAAGAAVADWASSDTVDSDSDTVDSDSGTVNSDNAAVGLPAARASLEARTFGNSGFENSDFDNGCFHQCLQPAFLAETSLDY